MHVTHLSLTNFRNYGRLELDLSPGATLLYGANAQGKTNLLEAIYYLATTRSPHAATDHQLLNWDAAQTAEPVVVGRLVAEVATQEGPRHLEMRLIQEQHGRGQSSFRREALVDRRKVRLMDLLGTLRAVMFLPEDVQLITGSPSERRRYMDITLCQVDSTYCRALSQYNKVLEQRNALLRQIAEGGRPDVLPVFTEKLVHFGSQIFARRTKFLAELARETQRVHYEALTAGHESIRLHYEPRIDPDSASRRQGVGDRVALPEQPTEPGVWAEAFAAALQAAQTQDLARGATTVGPHRDDWQFLLNGRALSSFGSRGQQRTAILALKIAEINWMTGHAGEMPVLLLDEVVAELDESRRAALLETVQRTGQAILTATDPGMFTDTFLQEATNLHVENGRIDPQTQVK